MAVLTGVPALDYIVVAAMVLTALGVIWTKALRPIIHAAKQAEETFPVLLSIAHEFEANGGSSLKDTIDKMADSATELYDYTHGFKHDFVNRLTVISGQTDLVDEKVDHLAERIGGLGGEVSELKDDVSALKDDVAEVKAIVDRRSNPRSKGETG